MRFHCTVVAAALLLAARPVAAQPAVPAPTAGEETFQIFVRGTQIGNETVDVARSGSGWVITSSGSLAAPIDFTVNRFEVTYGQDWQPVALTLEANSHNAVMTINSSFTPTTATNDVSQNSQRTTKQDHINPGSVILVNNVFGSYEGLAAKLAVAKAGDVIPIYVAPQGAVMLTVKSIENATLSGPSGSIGVRRCEVTFQNPQKPLEGVITVDDHQRLVRFEAPDAGLMMVRTDAASVSMRSALARNPTDSDVLMPANGFQLAGTLTTPTHALVHVRYPAVMLIGSASAGDRDDVVGRVPAFAELAGALADSGHVVLRFDRRGSGQSGGRPESATLDDYADDAIAAIKWLADRGDVDRHHVIVCGRGQDGAAIALIAASRDKTITGIVTIDAPADKGADLVLERQQRALAGLTLTDAERQSRVALQRQIDTAVLTGTGWTGVPDTLRQQADTPWFKSQLAFDPAEILPKVHQPILILQADQDPDIPPAQADRLAELAKRRKKERPPELVHLPDVNQTLVTGSGTAISPKIGDAIADWIKKL